MTDSWLFFTELRAGAAGHCETVWRWRHLTASAVIVSDPFAVLPDCVADARKAGYDAEKLPVALPK